MNVKIPRATERTKIRYETHKLGVRGWEISSNSKATKDKKYVRQDMENTT